jgi:3-hydroxybutyryl-CoA dehydrogenase
MNLVILADDTVRADLVTGADNQDIMWIKHVEEFSQYSNADGYLDLLFDRNPKRIQLLKNLAPKLVIVNSVVATLEDMTVPFVRFNAWPGFLKRPVAEASYSDEDSRLPAEKIFSVLNKTTTWVPDQPGFITARIIAMIINEAYFAVGEGVSTKAEVDTAMKLGTNYPFGPFEWCSRIGIKNVFNLLVELNKTNTRYKPAELLKQEAIF